MSISYTRPEVAEDHACDAVLATVTDVFAIPDDSLDQLLYLRIGFAGFIFCYDLDPADADGAFEPVPAPGETP
ncbi:hypothetical protein [Pseudoclavibacter endophyticus]|uniref:Uncharacterized protein n=1 Tax=Pseudoclavibacter endophyticus TaxID=1778590 RepID=A0A6H9WP96_9MICO|nr:hypothetical protein [Pseudoclavibacter endophyticus]KAB1646929.1 hypothetical protein F8O04_14500 [Pseudoclavibacter endophyticus]